MIFKFLFWFWLTTVIIFEEMNARPISYPGGWTIMQMNDFNKHSILIHFSPKINYSIGYKGEYWKKKEWQFHGSQFNFLVKRINTSKSQSNFYLKNGAGLAISSFNKNKNKIEPNLFSGISLDWENRRYFTSYENRINYNISIDKFFQQKVCFGFAPYLGKYGDLHSWIMVQVEHMPQAKNKVAFSPKLRMFKGDFLTEIGVSNYEDIMFNFIKRF